MFFVPVANLVTLGMLCIVRESGESERRLPAKAFRAILALVSAIVVCTLMAWFGTERMKTYGLGLVIALPFCLGFLSVLIYDSDGKRTARSCMGIASLSVVIPGVALLAFAMEGIVCLLMALPRALPLALLGGAIAWSIQDGIGAREGTAAVLVLILLFPPR